jgi:predicted nucleotide-binding protein
MPLAAYPDDPKKQFEFLVHQAERYVKQGRASPIAFKTWRNRALDWLKQNAPSSDLPDTLVVIPLGKVQRCLRVLLRARPLVPFLRNSSSVVSLKPQNTRKVFIVHGHNDALKNAVAHLIARLGLEPVILHEQANRGRTIIEKFIEHSDVGFAVVLLTPDDKGGLAGDSPDKYRPRARQNVIMELGFFLGNIGRERVAAIFDSGVEVPSDYSGVLFLPYDDDGKWQFLLAKEIRAAGLPVDLNKL